MKNFERFIDAGLDAVRRNREEIRQEACQSKAAFIAGVLNGNISEVSLVPIEEDRFFSSIHPEFPGKFVGTFFSTRFQSHDFAGNIRETFDEEQEVLFDPTEGIKKLCRKSNMRALQERGQELQAICPGVAVVINEEPVMTKNII